MDRPPSVSTPDRFRHVRLLLWEAGFSGGTERVSLQLVPEFLAMGIPVLWVTPPYRIEYYRRQLGEPEGLTYDTPHWDREASPVRWLNALLRRTAALPGTKIRPLQGWLETWRDRVNEAKLRRLIRQASLTHLYTPWTFGVKPPRLPIAVGGNIMDLNWHHFPENFPQEDRHRLDRWFVQWLRKADVLFPVSAFTRDEVMRVFRVGADRLQVVHHGADTRKAEREDGHDPAVAPRARRPMLFYPCSGVMAHKRHLILLQAALDLRRRALDFDLSLTGEGTQHFWNEEAVGNVHVEQCRRLCREHATLLSGCVHGLGYVDQEALDRLYATCTAVVLPTVFEGFGLPLIEAIERGDPVVCSDIPPFREQVGLFQCPNAVTMVPPDHVPALASALEAVLRTPPARLSAATRREILRRWSWRHAAEAYLDGLLAAGARKKGRGSRA